MAVLACEAGLGKPIHVRSRSALCRTGYRCQVCEDGLRSPPPQRPHTASPQLRGEGFVSVLQGGALT